MKTAVLFLIFNRPDIAKRTFAEIAKAKPSRLYIACDGARENKNGETELVNQTRKIVDLIDWDCEVKTLFQKENLGCGIAVSKAISWFFENEEMGIILEDDCLPHQSFFKYCEELLNIYKNNDRISMISGNNFQKSRKRGDFSYYFSNIFNIWGWATWKRSWNDFRLDVNELNDNLVLNEIKKRFPEKKFNGFLIRIYESIKKFRIDTWDFQFYFSQIAKGRVFIDPNVNLISNIGFGGYATHTHDKDDNMANIPVKAMIFPLKHPMKILINQKADKFFLNNYYISQKPLFKRIVNKIKRIYFSVDKAMIIVEFMGDLGNQMFQYAFYKALKAKYPYVEVKADISNYYMHNDHYDFELSKIFNINLDVATKLDLIKAGKGIYIFNNINFIKKSLNKIISLFQQFYFKIYKNKYIYIRKPACNAFDFNPEYFSLDIRDNYYFSGFWQNELYFIDIKSQLLSDFNFSESLFCAYSAIAKAILNTESISIHIKRRDYVNTDFDVLTIDYYKNAIEYILNRINDPVFFIFSDDIEYSEKHFHYLSNKHFVSENRNVDNYRDMLLMSKCKHNIIANSSFSFWGAYLNKNSNKIIIVPNTFAKNCSAYLVCKNCIVFDDVSTT